MDHAVSMLIESNKMALTGYKIFKKKKYSGGVIFGIN